MILGGNQLSVTGKWLLIKQTQIINSRNDGFNSWIEQPKIIINKK